MAETCREHLGGFVTGIDRALTCRAFQPICRRNHKLTIAPAYDGLENSRVLLTTEHDHRCRRGWRPPNSLRKRRACSRCAAPVAGKTMNREILVLADALAREKSVPKEIIFQALEQALGVRHQAPEQGTHRSARRD